MQPDGAAVPWKRVPKGEHPYGTERRRPWRREHATEFLPERVCAPDDGLTAELLTAPAALPRRQRAVVVLRYVEDREVEATAHLLGISPGTVKSQAARGLAALRDLLTNGADEGALR